MKKLTNENIEEKLLERVKIKASTYGQDSEEKNPIFKIEPNIIKSIYKNFIIPFTKEVEVLYLLERVSKQKNKKLYNEVKILVDKIIKHINEVK